MQQHQRILRVETPSKALTNITRQVEMTVSDSGIRTGLCTLFIRHTSASLLIQENADPDVLKDLENYFRKIVPEGPYYIHDAEGPDDMPAHIRTALTHTTETIPIANGRLVLGTWQGIYLWEHRSHSHSREVVIHILGE
ncbi:MAG: secondary thiamine-phosphate synthase enzyme YjbQ [Prochlorotrichaceae cyanobacterium]